MSSGMSSDAIIKHEIMDIVGPNVGKLKLREFPESSNYDQIRFSEGGLTFGKDGVLYGSCDAVWYIDNKQFIDIYDGKTIDKTPVVGLEGTDALSRGSSGNAQYQRFHHALGAVKNGLVGIYYLRKGKDIVQPDLYRMAYMASKYEKGYYIISQDLYEVKEILKYIDKYGIEAPETISFLENIIERNNKIWEIDKFSKYNYDWNIFAEKRSTIIEDSYIIKYAGRNKRNFTDSSQRAGHIAVGEMYLSKYLFYGKKLKYLLPRMSRADVEYLDKYKSDDKEWYLLRHEPDVEIITIDDLVGVNPIIIQKLLTIKDSPLKGAELQLYKECIDYIYSGLKNGTLKIK